MKMPLRLLLASVLPLIPSQPLSAQGACDEEMDSESLANSAPGPRLRVTGAPVVGGVLSLHVEEGPSDGIGALLYGADSAPIPLPGLGLLYPSTPQLGGGFLLASDGATVDAFAELGVMPTLCGQGIVLQAGVVDVTTGAAQLSNALDLRFGSPLRRIFDRAGFPFSGSESLATADLNNDGWTDIIVAAFSDGVYLLTSTPAGYYEQSLLGSIGEQVLPAHLNADDILDLFVSYPNGNSVALGLPSGGFDLQPAVTQPQEVAALGDLNGDGLLDALTARVCCGDFVELKVNSGDGDGGFAFVEEILVPSTEDPFEIRVADVTGNGWNDVVLAAEHLHVLPGLGGGSLGTSAVYDMAQVPPYDRVRSATLDVGDLNNDGYVDVVTAYGYRYGVQWGPAPEQVRVYLSQADLSTPLFLAHSYTYAERVFHLQVSDIDEDGNLDLALLGRNSDDLNSGWIMRGDGSGAFPNYEKGDFICGGNVWHFDEHVGLAVADVDFDGRKEFISGSLSLLQLSETSEFEPEHMQVLVGANKPEDLVAADFDLDGFVDIATVGSGGTDVVVFRGNGDGTFKWGIFRAYLPFEPDEVCAADMDGDGTPDLLTSDDLGGQIQLRLGLGDGTFDTAIYTDVGPSPSDFVVADIDNDGHPDLIVANESADTVSIHPGIGNGTFGTPQALSVGSGPVTVKVSDLNLDGSPDIIVGNRLSSSVSVLIQNPTGFERAQSLGVDTSFSVWAIETGDIDGDGDPDLVAQASAPGTTQLNVFLGAGDGTFAAPTVYDLVAGIHEDGIVLTDVNGDGRLDLVSSALHHSFVYPGSGDGTFQVGQGEYRYLAAGCDINEATLVVDLNRDGMPDLARLRSYSDSDGDVEILLNLAGALED